MTYAQYTKVPVEQTRNEIERTLERYGADAFGYAREEGRAAVQFRLDERYVKFVMPVPTNDEILYGPTGRTRSNSDADAYRKRLERQRWRALLLVIKAKLEAVESGVATFEQEFMGNLLLPNGQTVSEFMGPQIAQAYTSGQMPKGMQLQLTEGAA